MNDNKVNIHDGHRKRLRKRFSETGLNNFQSHEILELMLFYVIPRANTNEIAHNLINRFGNIYKVLRANPEELRTVKGVGFRSTDFIKTFNDICFYYLGRENYRPEPINVINYVKDYFSKINHKMFLIMSMGSDMSIKNTFTFTPDMLESDNIIREISMMILKTQTYEIIIAHNYGGGFLSVPSRQDYFAVRLIAEGLKPLGINVLDYIVSNGSSAISMYKEGAVGF